MIDKKYLKPGTIINVHRSYLDTIGQYRVKVVRVDEDDVFVETERHGIGWFPIGLFFLQAGEEHEQDIQELKQRIKELEAELKKQTRNYKDLVTAAKTISYELEYLNLD